MSPLDEKTRFWSACPAVREDLTRVQAVLEEEIIRYGGTVAAGLHEFSRRESKLLRPGLVVLAARIHNRQDTVTPRIVKIAAAIEMLHLASLVHDDIIDGADYRRGSPALHKAFPVNRAILMGDYLFARCFRLLADNARPESVALVSSTAGRIVTSEISGLSTERPGKRDASLRYYRRRIMGKTAILFILGLHLGLSESCGPQDPLCRYTADILRRVGFNFGMAFQIIDDILDITGDPRNTGKPKGMDIRSGTITLPLIFAIQSGGWTTFEPFLRTLDGGDSLATVTNDAPATTGDMVDRICRLIEESGGADKARLVAATYLHRARREIARLPGGTERAFLDSIVKGLVEQTVVNLA